ncbi:MAG: PilZ domain-containing protein [Sphingobium sp.]|nr:PilZ domain-containing protein [Sphingobium sp.]
MSVAPKPKDMRRFQREEVCCRIEIAGPGLEPVSALMVNVSPLGCLLRCSQPLQRGAALHLDLPFAGRIDAQVVWVMGARIGLEFHEEIDAAPYLAMLPTLHRPGDEMGTY